MPQTRLIFGLMTVSALGLIAYALYTQYVDGLEPCPLCITQRGFFLLIAVFALLAAIHAPRQLGIRIYASLTALSAIGGGIVAGRQVWLQHLPEDQVPACGPGLSYILDTFPLMEAIRVLFTGDGNCAEVVWTFLGLSMPTWSLLCFIGYGLLSVILLVKPRG